MNRVIKGGRNVTVVSLIVALGVSGCATTTTSSGVTESSGGCNPAAMAGLGALLGALAGGRNNWAGGAALGAGIGALGCMAWNYRTRQVQSAEQVNAAYRAANNGALPAEPRIIAYEVGAAPNTISAGSPMTINSRITVVQGASGPPPVVEQEIEVGYDGKRYSSARKVANAGVGAGEYQTQFVLDMPKGVPQGSYPVNTVLYVNGIRAQFRSTSVQVVWNAVEERFALAH